MHAAQTNKGNGFTTDKATQIIVDKMSRYVMLVSNTDTVTALNIN